MHRLHRTLAVLGLLALTPHCASPVARPGAGDGALDRTVLPIPEPVRAPVTELDVRNATAPPRFEVRAPEGAPNVVIVLIDDMGFGQPSTFGGGVPMPTLDRLAAEGLRFNHFHTTALCSPTRVALKSGRNHHVNNTGAVMDIATGFPGNTGSVPASVAPLAEMLRLNGYGTAAFGKWHETAPWEVSDAGPTDRWPTRQGFDAFYGFLGGETNQWAPLLHDGVAQVEIPQTPGYHFTTDMTNRAITWMRAQKSLRPDKPFFVYFAPGATHAPHHVPKEWIDRHRGRFDAGWDAYREATLARQIELGVVPPGTRLAPKPDAIRDWNDLPEAERRFYARQMEVFAAFGEHTDHEVGRLVAALDDMDALENTLFIYIAGDNGSSAEGGMNGLSNETAYFNGIPEAVGDAMRHADAWGGPSTYPHFAAGWAVAGNTPFAWAKQVASNYGGTRNGMVVHWPRRIAAKGEVRTQWHHVVDIAPTVLEAAHLPFPRSVNGTEQRPFDGVSLAYTFDDAAAPGRHRTQYFEILGNRGIYHDGWLAGTVHRAPWELTPRAPLADDRWELYDTRTDFALVDDLAASNPAKLAELKDLFLREAVRNQVLPIDDRGLERFDAAMAGRPDLMGGRTSMTVHPGMVGMMENAFINTKNRSYTVTADLDVPAGGAEGVILAQAGRFAGWSLYVKGGRPAFAYNYLGRKVFTVAADRALPRGRTTVTLDFAYDGGGLGKGGTATLSIDGAAAASGRVEHTVPLLFSGDEGADVGTDDGTVVTDAYPERNNRFTGTIRSVRIDLRPAPAGPSSRGD